MSFHTTIARLREASYAAPAAGEDPNTCRVGRQDLRTALHVIDRLDADLRQAGELAQGAADAAARQVSAHVADARLRGLRGLVEQAISWIETGGGRADSLCADLRKALASAPVAKPKRAPADDWRVTAIAECLEAEWDEMTPDLAESNARIIVGYLIDYEKESALIGAKRAGAPMADNWQQYALPGEATAEQVCERMNAEVTRRTVAAMRAGAPVAVEAQPSDAEIMAIVREQCPDFDDAHEGPDQDDMIRTARALLSRYAAPQASEAVRDADHPVFAFLLGEGPLRGVHFGERAPGAIGKWWWRQELRAALSAQPGTQKDASLGSAVEYMRSRLLTDSTIHTSDPHPPRGFKCEGVLVVNHPGYSMELPTFHSEKPDFRRFSTVYAMEADEDTVGKLRAALILARDSHGVMLMTDPPQDAWKARRVDDAIREALAAQPVQKQGGSDA